MALSALAQEGVLSNHLWVILGLIGQGIFAARFLVQWIASEKKKESHIPLVFWYLSLAGSMILLAYAIYRRDPVFILGQTTGFIVYIRNLMLIYKKRWNPAQSG
jgi:lipid-A-disaccharide synthase-like uncharacterized protein